MAFSVAEKVESRDGDTAEGTRMYVISHDGVGDDDEYTARVALLAAAPTSIGTSPYIQSRIDVSVTEVVSSTPTVYLGTVEYVTVVPSIQGKNLKRPAPTPTGSVSFSFNAQAQGGHIDTSITTVYCKYYTGDVVGNPSQMFSGKLNVSADYKTINGLDLNPPEPNMELSWVLPNATVDPQFRVDLLELVGTVCSVDFSLMNVLFPAGELFLNYMRGSRRTSGDHEVSLGFSYKKNDASFALAGLTAPKKGHEYAWIHSMKVENPEEPDMAWTPKSLCIEQVWPKVDWTLTPLTNVQTLIPV